MDLMAVFGERSFDRHPDALNTIPCRTVLRRWNLAGHMPDASLKRRGVCWSSADTVSLRRVSTVTTAFWEIGQGDSLIIGNGLLSLSPFMKHLHHLRRPSFRMSVSEC